MHRGSEPDPALNAITGEIVDAALKVHRALGPGLLESVYQQCVCFELEDRGLRLEKQKPLAITYTSHTVANALRLDLLVENRIIVELKAVDLLLPVHRAQLLTYLKLSTLRVGLLINFNVILLKDGIHRLAA